MLRILLPVDGSEPSMRAVRHVIGLKAQLKDRLEVLLLNVQPALPASNLLLEGRPSEIERLEAPARAHGAEIQAPAGAALAAAGIEYTTHVEIGDVGPLAAAFAATHHCQMIVLGTRGLGSFAGLWFGSVARKIAHLSAVPVVFVP